MIRIFFYILLSRCIKTPCSVELGEGNVRIIAALEQYDIADTTVSIKQNNQSIRIRMKANFGVLEIKPAYSDGIGKNEGWSLVINGKAASSWENKLSPNKYKVELSHRCYEDLSFDVGINRDKREVFDMASYVKLKKGGLVLNAERDGKPVSEVVHTVRGSGEYDFFTAKIYSKPTKDLWSVNLDSKENSEIVELKLSKPFVVETFYTKPNYLLRINGLVIDGAIFSDLAKKSSMISRVIPIQDKQSVQITLVIKDNCDGVELVKKDEGRTLQVVLRKKHSETKAP